MYNSSGVMSPQEGTLFGAILAAKPEFRWTAQFVQVLDLTTLSSDLVSKWAKANADRMGFCPVYQKMANKDFAENYLTNATSLALIDSYFGNGLVLKKFGGEKRLLAICEIGDVNAARNSANISFAVDGEFEGTGLMRLFVSECLEMAKIRGLRRVNAEVAAGNDPSARLLHSLGFRHEGLLEQGEVLDGKPLDLNIWGKLL